jgi:hypothetical protein
MKKWIVLAYVFYVALCCRGLYEPALAAASATAQQIQLSTQVIFGMQQQYSSPIFNYTEPSTTTAQYFGNTTVSIPANSTNNVINTATLFPAWNTPVCIGIAEITTPSLNLNVGLSSGGPRFQLAPGGYLVYRSNGGLPSIYVDNPSASSAALVQVFGLSN